MDINDFDAVLDVAAAYLQRHCRAIRGQTIVPQDSLDWHVWAVMRAEVKRRDAEVERLTVERDEAREALRLPGREE